MVACNVKYPAPSAGHPAHGQDVGGRLQQIGPSEFHKGRRELICRSSWWLLIVAARGMRVSDRSRFRLNESEI